MSLAWDGFQFKLDKMLLCNGILGVLLILQPAQSLTSSPILSFTEESKDLQYVLLDIIYAASTNDDDDTCVTVICDAVYLNVFEGGVFRSIRSIPIIMIVVADYEDLLSPNFLTLEALRRARKDGCKLYVILLANGLQASRLLRFGDRHRVLDTRAKYVMLYDIRLFHSDLHYIWKRIVNIIFLKLHKVTGNQQKTWFDLSTVPFPNPIRNIFVSKRVDIWRNGRFHYKRPLFVDKTVNLNNEVLNVVYLDHTPSVVVKKNNGTNDTISGVEMEILSTLADKMNFKPRLYQPQNIDTHKWGQKLLNGSFSGVLGEMVNGKADIALGNLQYTSFHLELSDLSQPYISQCMTFLTPEALTDNSWKTLILPFKLYMWIALLLMLFVTGVIFFGLAKYYIILFNATEESTVIPSKSKRIKNENTQGLYLFGEIINSILYTYGMLLLVSLPKLPTGWSIRLLTGWYWLYCLLIVVSYRASMTAILANPTQKVTIDTIKELVDSKLTCGGWGSETRRFFTDSQDELISKIGERFENADNPFLAASRVAEGKYAYYDNIYYHKFLSVTKINLESINNENSTNITMKANAISNLHIMKDCIVNIPVSIGFQKNSPLKTLADVYLKRIVEVGLVEKWLSDAMYQIRSLQAEEVQVKALMNLQKLYGAFVALGVGYLLASVCLLCELIHWHCFVLKNPAYDKYNMDEFYSSKNK